MHIYLHHDVIPWESNNRADFVFFFYSRLQYEFLEGLMDFFWFKSYGKISRN